MHYSKLQEWVKRSIGAATVLLILLPAAVRAQEQKFVLLQPLPGVEGDPAKLGDYFNDMLGLAIALGGILAVVQITIGGIQYMTSEAVPSKEAAVSKMRSAILGLLLILASYLILFTINPDLVKIAF